MGAAAPKSEEFFWTDTTEPHAARRRAILAKYGDKVRALYGYDHSTAVQVGFVCCLQLVMAYVVRDMPWWKIVFAGYTVGGTANQNLLSAQHELSHFLAFKRPLYNRILSILSNCPVVVPMAVAFRKYHQEHHSHLGVDGWDVDLPSFAEANIIVDFFAKFAWTFVYIIVYGVRPLLMRPKEPGLADAINWATVLAFDVGILYFLGVKSLLYLLLGTVFGGGLHPIAGHLIAEHYMFLKGQETYSYYGPLNCLTYNVGYHNEHHDFPQIPHTRLHKLRAVAPEFYNTLSFHSSWTWVVAKFVTDPEVGPWTRMRRKTRDGTPGGHPVLDPVMSELAKPSGGSSQAAAAIKVA